MSVYLETGGKSTQIWTRQRAQGNRWVQGTVPLISSTPYTLRFEAVAGTSFTGDIALDDIKFVGCPPGPTPPPPPTYPPGVGVGDCNFESCVGGLSPCCWKNIAQGDNFDWIRGKGLTPSVTTGPSSDHTYGNYSGHYMYIEASDQSLFSWYYAKLVSRKMKGVPKPGLCSLTIWYHMSGSNVGRLTILKEPDSVFSFSYPTLWTARGDQGSMWKNVTVDLYTTAYSSNDFQLSVRADQVTSRSSDIAVDDFMFSDGCDAYFVDTKPCYNLDVCHPVTNETMPPTDCHELFCVNGGTCYIQFGESYCHCVGLFGGRRCEKPITVTSAPTTRKTTTKAPTTMRLSTAAPTVSACPNQACDPTANDCVCSVLSEPLYCQTCEQTAVTCDYCVCQVIQGKRMCYFTQAYVNQLKTPEPGKPTELASSSHHGISCNHNRLSLFFFFNVAGMYAAIGVSIAVVGIIVVAVIIYSILSKK